MGGRISKDALKPVMAIFALVWRNYKLQFCAVVAGILVSAWATLQSTLFTQTLIDDYITPMLQTGSNDYGPLALAIGKLALVAVLGIAAAYLYNRLMVTISQGTLRDLRIDVFEHMETLPISYFDTHSHGDIMSIYTNDIDTLRQLISQTIPQFVNSGVTIVMTLVSMIVLSVPLTIMTLVMVALMLFASGKIGGAAAGHFADQQKRLGDVNGFIEETISGEKVVKVFCHEERSIAEFHERNHALRDSAMQANRLSNILMPVVMSLGNVSYVLCAIIGSLIAVGTGALSLSRRSRSSSPPSRRQAPVRAACLSSSRSQARPTRATSPSSTCASAKTAASRRARSARATGHGSTRTRPRVPSPTCRSWASS